MFYMAIRYEGGTHGITGKTEPDLELTDSESSANESASSSEQWATAMLGDLAPPSAPVGLAAISGLGVVDLSWTVNFESDIAGYDVYRSTSSGGPVGLQLR